VKKTNYFLLSVLLSFVLLACEDKKQPADRSDSSNTAQTKQPEESEAKSSTGTPLPYDNPYERTVRILSGIPQQAGSPLAYLDTSSSWKSFAAAFDTNWAVVEEKRLGKMRDWRNEELTDVNSSSVGVFYPFSGPDVLNAVLLFPKAQSYTLLALEPIGELPDFATMSDRQKQEYYLSVETSLNDLLQKSYFITKHMLRDLQRHKVNGTLPLMCLFLKRTGHTILNVQKVGIDSTGSVFERTDSTQFKGSRGVRIDFVAKNSQEVRSVYYFKCDLADSGLKTNKGLTAYLQKLGTVHTYLKSASYLLHYKEFSTVRNTIFEKSDFIVQDDSGIAFHYFDKEKWKIQLYGKYSKPIADFPHIKEPDLKAAYTSDSTVKPLPFELGYRWGTGSNNMLKATRITP
jgi:hypothetical protein